jgi:HK97 family phage prohead protease
VVAVELSLEVELSQHLPTCRRGEGFADVLDFADDGRISGRIVPLGKWVELRPNLLERYEPGVFDRQMRDPSRVKICLEHEQVIGLVRTIEERSDGVYFEGRISMSDDIPEARKARAMRAEGLADELSVGFQTFQGGSDIQCRSDGVTTWRHRKARLQEISLVPWGAMGREATVTRARFYDEDGAIAAAEKIARRDAERAWLSDFRARVMIGG